MNPFSALTGGYLTLAKGIALLAVLLSLWWAWHSFTGHYVDIGRAEIQAKWDAQIELDKKAALQRKADNLDKEDKAQLAINSIVSTHENEVNKIRAKYDKLNQDKTLADSSIANWRERLRLELAKAANGLPEISIPTSGTPISRQDGDAATLRTACEITTLDYDALHKAWDNACIVYGCK